MRHRFIDSVIFDRNDVFGRVDPQICACHCVVVFEGSSCIVLRYLIDIEIRTRQDFIVVRLYALAPKFLVFLVDSFFPSSIAPTFVLRVSHLLIHCM